MNLPDTTIAKRPSLRARSAAALCQRRLATAVLVGLLAAVAGSSSAILELWQQAAQVEQARARNPVALGTLQAVWTGKSFAYLLWPEPEAMLETPPLLIDAGSDPTAHAIQVALAARNKTLADVAHVLLTHGHAHHAAGLVALSQSHVHVAMADGTLALGDTGPHNAWLRTRQRLEGPVRLPPRPLTFVQPGERLLLSGHTLTVVALPGHTQGSVGYAWQDGLIAGDAVFGPSLCGRVLTPGPAWAQESAATAQAVLARIPAESRAFIADGHTGITRRCFCAERPPQP